MLLCIYEAIRHIYRHITEYSALSAADVGADQIMPLIIYVTIHSDLSYPNAVLEVRAVALSDFLCYFWI